MLDPNNYESTEALNTDELLEYGSAAQVEIDGLDADLEDLKEKTKGKKEAKAKQAKRIAMIFHAQESGASLFKLKDGGITEERPDLEGSLPLGDAPQQPVELPLDDDLIEEVHEAPVGRVEQDDGNEDSSDKQEGSKPQTYPAEQDGQIYKAKGTLGNTLNVRQSVRGWTGRISGKPVALDKGTALEAMAGVEDYLKEEFVLDWTPTIEIAEVSEAESEADSMVDL
jgi:hypothetical protein